MDEYVVQNHDNRYAVILDDGSTLCIYVNRDEAEAVAKYLREQEYV